MIKASGFIGILCIMALMILLPCAAAQQSTQQTDGGDDGDSVPKPKIPPPMPTIPTIPKEQSAPQDDNTTELVFIAGNVIQEDGNPPPFGTVIELDCGDTVTREAMVDSLGRYGFQVGSGNRIGRLMPDASDRIGEDIYGNGAEFQTPGTRTLPAILRTTPLHVRLRRCELRAQYPGYRSTSVRMKIGTIFGYTEVEPILVYRALKVQGTLVSLTALLAPKKARKSVEQATKALRKQRFDEAEGLLKSAIKSYPGNAEAWYELGEMYHMQKRVNEARNSYSKAVEADKMFVRPHIRLARLAMEVEDWKGAVRYADEALKLDPIDFPEAYYLHALASFNLADLEAAERSARKGQRLDLDHGYPDLHLILANILSMKNDSRGSMEEMRSYLRVAGDGEHAAVVRARLEEKEKPAKAGSR